MFQRTPNFSMPAGNRELGEEEIGKVKADYRAYRQAAKESFFGVPIEGEPVSAFDVTDDVRRETFQAGWDDGNLVGLIGAFNDILFDQAANDTAADFIRDKIRATVKDPEVAEIAVPVQPPRRDEAAVPRHGLLRDVQPAERRPRRPAHDADHRDHADGHPHDGRRHRAATPSCSPPASTR